MSAVATFWMIWNPEGKAPEKTHVSYNNAFSEVTRLREKEPLSTFYILQAKTRIEPLMASKVTDL